MTSFRTRALMVTLVLSAFAAADNPAEAAGNLAYTSCSEQTAVLLVPAALMPTLPPGFVYTAPSGDSLLAAVHISGSRCASVDGGGPTQEMIAFALVKPPAAMLVPEVSEYAVALAGYTNRPATLAKYASWGITDLFESATVNVELGVLPLVQIGKVTAKSTTSSVTTQMTAVGTPSHLSGGRIRAYYVQDGMLIASFDAAYTPQKGLYATGTVVQTGFGFLSVGIYPAVGSHAFDYDLAVGFVQYY